MKLYSGLALTSLLAASLAWSGRSEAQAAEPVAPPAPAAAEPVAPPAAAAPAGTAPAGTAPVAAAPKAPAPAVTPAPATSPAPAKEAVTTAAAPTPTAAVAKPHPTESPVTVAEPPPATTGAVIGAAQPAPAAHDHAGHDHAAHGHDHAGPGHDHAGHDHAGPGHDHAGHDHAAHGPSHVAPHTGHGEGAHGEDAHGEGAHGEGAHGEGAHGAHHDPHFSDVNWFTGLVGEKEGVPPSLLWRAPGTPVPLGALLVNAAILFFLLFKFGGPAIQKGLLERKKRVVSGIEAATAMKDEASGQLFHYEEKLRKIDEEIENIKAQMREQAEAERKRILSEAKTRREQLEADARLLVSQEMKLAREELFKEVVAEAMRSAEETIKKQVSAADQQRLADDFLVGLDGALRGGAARGVEKLS